MNMPEVERSEPVVSADVNKSYIRKINVLKTHWYFVE